MSVPAIAFCKNYLLALFSYKLQIKMHSFFDIVYSDKITGKKTITNQHGHRHHTCCFWKQINLLKMK